MMEVTPNIHKEITAEFKRYKTEKTSLEHRKQFVEDITERHFAKYGKMPGPTILERLASLILREDSSDNASNKTRKEDYPYLTENQYRRRTEGRHKGRLSSSGKLQPLQREVPFSLAATVAVDGKNYAYPTRRNIDVIEQMDIEYYGKEGVGHDD